MPVAHVKLNSDLPRQQRLGLERGPHVQARPEHLDRRLIPQRIKIDYEGEATFTQSPTGNSALDAIVAASLPPGNPPVSTTSIEFPSSLNLGVGIELGNQWLLSLEADWTEWSTFQSLAIIFPTLVGRDVFRPTLWEDSWAYRAGLEKGFGDMGGPHRLLLRQHAAARLRRRARSCPTRTATSTRPASATTRETLGVRRRRPCILKFKERAILPPVPQTDNYYGTYKETGLVMTAGIRLAL